MLSDNETFYAVTGSQKPYIFDLPKVISLPSGAEFRFRYRPKWVEQKIRDSIHKEPEKMVGKPIILLFHSQESRRIFPLRKATIIDINRIGPMIFVRFRLGEFSKVDIDNSIVPYATEKCEEARHAMDEQASLALKITGAIEGNSSYSLARPLPEGWYLRTSVSNIGEFNWACEDEAGAWASIVTLLAGERNLSGVPLFYILGFEKESGELVRATEIKNCLSVSKNPAIGFKLIEGDRYRLRVVEWCEPLEKNNYLPEVEVDCEPHGISLALEGASNLVVGRYDVLEFTFYAQKPGYGEIALSASPLRQENSNKGKQDPGDSKDEVQESTSAPVSWQDWPSIFVARIPVKVTYRARRIISMLLIGFAGLALYFLSPKWTEGTYKEGLQLLGLFLALPAFGGWAERLVKMREHVSKFSPPGRLKST